MESAPWRLIDTIQFMDGEGEVAQGTSLSIEAAKAEVLRRFPGKPYCLVRRWIVADVLQSDEARSAVEVTGRKSRMVYAHEVIEDQAGRFQSGWWARSTWELSYDQNGFFETRSTVYVLMGEGYLKVVPLEVIDGIF